MFEAAWLLLLMNVAGSLSFQDLFSRRSAFEHVGLLAGTYQSTLLQDTSNPISSSNFLVTKIVASSSGNDHADTFGLTDAVVSSLVYGNILGSGSFKTVYRVSTATPITTTKERPEPQGYALAVQKLRNKADAKDGMRGVQVAEQLQSLLSSNEEDQQFFESVQAWWFQTHEPLDFTEGQPVFSSAPNALPQRTRRPPSRFLGSKYLVALKPVYDMDLKAFCKKAPLVYPIEVSDLASITSGRNKNQNEGLQTTSIAGVPLTESGAVKLALGMVHAGRLMHATGLIHRDIKPKNIMLNDGHPVIIDFGFSYFVSHSTTKNTKGVPARICFEQPGIVKGEVDYVLAKDVAAFRGCQEGDTYAMGKTIYEVLFSDAPLTSEDQKLTEQGAQIQNERYRAILERNDVVTTSRFCMMAASTKETLLTVIRGLCRDERPSTFKEAETLLSALSLLIDYH